MLLWQFARHNISLETKARILAAMNSHQPYALAALSGQVDPANPRATIVPILNMIFHHELSTLIDDTKISDNSLVYLPNQNGG
jgi:hypothetical protein